MNTGMFSLSLALGFTGGLLRACQGAYKDSPYEPFQSSKFIRSLIFGSIGGIFWYLFSIVSGLKIPLAVFFPLVVFFDSIVTEMYKRGIRLENLSKYKMPTIFHVNGFIIHNRYVRILLILNIIIFLILLYPLSQVIVDKVPLFFQHRPILGLFFGFIAGVLAASGGASLDSAWEGFEYSKFLRSVYVAMFWGLILTFYTTNPGLIIYACFGLDRMSIEFNKTFVKKLKSGKFKATHPTIPHWLDLREKLLHPYLFTWAVYIYLLASHY
ncbi:hypothetical protein A3C98_01315 [Candidatus Roizmanbacteria bacterium RIFCSPHIGHO2_02_FULL_37_15]|nr:MAG: hypothetical protein A3C98_01315 [Candidatus Roizmanbacteria bacterium RIFCSPHIGHO2_02_FULL_37_15]